MRKDIDSENNLYTPYFVDVIQDNVLWFNRYKQA